MLKVKIPEQAERYIEENNIDSEVVEACKDPQVEVAVRSAYDRLGQLLEENIFGYWPDPIKSAAIKFFIDDFSYEDFKEELIRVYGALKFYAETQDNALLEELTVIAAAKVTVWGVINAIRNQLALDQSEGYLILGTKVTHKPDDLF